jgi:hypothetical protein
MGGEADRIPGPFLAVEVLPTAVRIFALERIAYRLQAGQRPRARRCGAESRGAGELEKSAAAQRRRTRHVLSSSEEKYSSIKLSFMRYGSV